MVHLSQVQVSGPLQCLACLLSPSLYLSISLSLTLFPSSFSLSFHLSSLDSWFDFNHPPFFIISFPTRFSSNTQPHDFELKIQIFYFSILLNSSVIHPSTLLFSLSLFSFSSSCLSLSPFLLLSLIFFIHDVLLFFNLPTFHT